jgi:hypothetical protein
MFFWPKRVRLVGAGTSASVAIDVTKRLLSLDGARDVSGVAGI